MVDHAFICGKAVCSLTWRRKQSLIGIYHAFSTLRKMQKKFFVRFGG